MRFPRKIHRRRAVRAGPVCRPERTGRGGCAAKIQRQWPQSGRLEDEPTLKVNLSIGARKRHSLQRTIGPGAQGGLRMLGWYRRAIETAQIATILIGVSVTAAAAEAQGD